MLPHLMLPHLMLLHLKLNNFQLKYIEKTGRKLEALAVLRIDYSNLEI
jgi:hypothetical protein